MDVGFAAVKGRCQVCGAGHSSCGPDTSHTNPVDLPQEGSRMAGNLKTYDVIYNGVRTQMKLTEEDAERLGATEVSSKKRTAANKARTAESAETATAEEPAATAEQTAEEPAATAADDNVCPECGFEAKTAGGLASHQRSHED